MKQLFTFILLFFTIGLFAQPKQEVRKLTFVNLLPYTQQIVTIWKDGRKAWYAIPPTKTISIPVCCTGNEKIVVSVAPAKNTNEVPIATGSRPKYDCVSYYSKFVWEIQTQCAQCCMVFYLDQTKKPRV